MQQENAEGKCYFIRHAQCYYIGEWKDALPHGQGTAIYRDGSYYHGQFTQGEAHDKNGLLILPNGAYYKGETVDSKIDGRGVMREKIGEGEYVYTGDWRQGRPHGEGEERYDDGGSYIGSFVNGVKHCYDGDREVKEKSKDSNLRVATYISGGEEP